MPRKGDALSEREQALLPTLIRIFTRRVRTELPPQIREVRGWVMQVTVIIERRGAT